MSLPPYRIEQTKNRTSRATIHGDAILIKLAKNLSDAEEARHIEVLLRRMTKSFLREKTRISIDPFRELLEGASQATVHLVTGESIRFEVIIGTSMRTKRTAHGWRITRNARDDKRALHRVLWRLLAKSTTALMCRLVLGINEETVKADIRSVTLKFMRSRWGSCGRKGQIALSTPLLLTSAAILRYVIIHELCHMPHPNHSAKFWNTVEEFEPEYQERVNELRKYKIAL